MLARLAIGLRPRLVAALVLTAAVTLAVAAVAILPRLERRLRHEEVRSLLNTAVAARPAFADLPLDTLRPGDEQLERLAHSLERRTGARVIVVSATGQPLVDTRPSEPREQVPDVRAPRPRGTFAKGGGSRAGEARVAVPVRDGPRRFVVTLAKPLDDVAAAASDVRHAFTTAALAGLAVAFLLGLAIATTLLRRLSRLHSSALEVAESGLDIELPEDRSRDEVGDLARAFATMQQRLRRQEEARRTFVATASHELRTPLASLEAMLELVEADLAVSPPDVADARLRAAAAHAQSGRLAALAAGLLDLSRLDAGGELRSELVEVGELCRAVAAEFEARGEISLDGADAPAPMWAIADPGSVARVLRILVDNALRYAGSPVDMAVTADPDGVAVAVRDRGPGVLAEERELVFERFRRGRSASPEGGFGLGLAIARELAERMHGRLSVEDADPGARFVLELPAAEPELVRDDHDLDGDAPAGEPEQAPERSGARQ